MNLLWLYAVLRSQEEEDENILLLEISFSKFDKWLFSHDKIAPIVCLLLGILLGILPIVFGFALYYLACVL